MSQLARWTLSLALLLCLAQPSPSWAQDGGKLYKWKCAFCHSDDGRGKPIMKAPAIKGNTEENLKTAARTPKHASIREMKPEEMKAIVAHLASLK